MNNRDIIALIIGGTIFIIFIMVNIRRASDKEEVLHDHSFTLGWIVSYSKIGDHRTRTMEYKYSVEQKTFSRTISPKVNLAYCEQNEDSCSRLRFVVMYSNKDHSKSLIDLRHEMSFSGKLTHPNDYSDFQ